jgi:hypothetical protein
MSWPLAVGSVTQIVAVCRGAMFVAGTRQDFLTKAWWAKGKWHIAPGLRHLHGLGCRVYKTEAVLKKLHEYRGQLPVRSLDPSDVPRELLDEMPTLDEISTSAECTPTTLLRETIYGDGKGWNLPGFIEGPLVLAPAYSGGRAVMGLSSPAINGIAVLSLQV